MIRLICIDSYNLEIKKNFIANQMTRTILVTAFIFFCLNNVNGQNTYQKDPGFLGSLGGDQVPLNGRDYSNDKVNTYYILLKYNMYEYLKPIYFVSFCFSTFLVHRCTFNISWLQSSPTANMVGE